MRLAPDNHAASFMLLGIMLVDKLSVISGWKSSERYSVWKANGKESNGDSLFARR
jgi:hypothetical protein